MAGTTDTLQQEKQLTSDAVKKLRVAVRNQISKTTNEKTGEALKIGGAGSRFKNNRLQRIVIQAPHYIFKQNYGFEGQKSNGVNQRLKATDVFSKAIEESNILEKLADDLSELRMEQVIALTKLT
jgi:hypothetical protein